MSGETPVNASYSLAAQCGSEIIATALTIYLGESIIANELLSKTKGARMGWLAVALGFGLSFGVTIWMLGFISAHLNPATCLALWVIGKISFLHFLALSAAEFAGAFIGACLVFLHFLPHFKTVPEPMATTGDELLLRSRDALSPEALAMASYDTRDKKRSGSGGGGVVGGVGQAIRDIKYYFAETHEAPLEHKELVEVVRTYMPHCSPADSPTVSALLSICRHAGASGTLPLPACPPPAATPARPCPTCSTFIKLMQRARACV